MGLSLPVATFTIFFKTIQRMDTKVYFYLLQVIYWQLDVRRQNLRGNLGEVTLGYHFASFYLDF